jgi:KDO2-lipid IV(A) lauroyltransferase
MKQLTGWLGRALSFLIFKSPAFVRLGLAWFLAFLWFDVLRIRRKVVLDNLRKAFPEWTERERLQTARTSLRHLGLNFIEYSYLPFLNRDNVDRYFEFHGLGVFEEALAKRKGVLLLTLHLGHGDLCAAALAVKGYPMVMVSKFFKVQWLNDLWFGMRERVGMKFVGPRNSSFQLLRALKNGSAVIIPLDQFTGPPIGVRTKFFGIETGTAAGFAIMANRSEAPVISVYAVRKPDGRHAIHFVREMKEQGTASLVTQSFNDELESFVRLHPDQWMWLHKRWKRFVE